MTRIRAWLDTHSEAVVAAIVLVGLGAVGFVGSAGHVLEVAERNGQKGTGAWSVVGTVEVLAAFSGWLVTRREGWRRWVALAILAAATTFTIAANLEATDPAHRNFWGYAMAVTPAAVFIAAVVLAETSDRPRRAEAKAAKRTARTLAKAPATPPVKPPANEVANPAKPQVSALATPPEARSVEPVNLLAKMTAKDAVMAAIPAEVDLAMGEIVLATGRPRSTVKLAVKQLVKAGQLVSFGDPDSPRYALAEMATEVTQ